MDPNDISSSSNNNCNHQLSILQDPVFLQHLEDTIRRSVREVLQEMYPYINLPPWLLPDQNIQPRYRLQFINKVKDPIFTTKPVTDNNGDPIQVEIYDSYTGSRVSPDCSLSSAKVRITVLDAEFWKNKGVNRSRSEFNQSVLSEREGKGPILTGPGLIIQLENGVGAFEDIVVNDNSSWTKSGFRPGVMVVVDGEEGYLNGERVREGVGDHFQVRDRRGEASQKPDQLELKHGVQSLEKVGKDRASLLQKKNIKTVEDFLWWYYNKEPELRKILRIKSESDKGWKSMVKHAMQCANEFNAKYNALNISSQPRQALVHTAGRTVPLQTNGGPRIVGSGLSVRNPCENNLLYPDPSILNMRPMQHTFAGVLQVEVPNDLVLLDNSSAIGESTPNNNFQFPSRSNRSRAWPRKKAKIKVILKLIPFLVGRRSQARIVPPTIYQPLENISQPQQSLAHPIGRNKSLYTNDGPRVVGSGSSEPNPHENDIIEGDTAAIFGQLPMIYDISSMNVFDEHISTASGEHLVEAQHPLFHETNHTAIERGNIVNVNSMQSTTGDGFAQFEIPDEQVLMEDLLANAGNSLQGPSMSDSFNPGLSKALDEEDFVASLFNNSEYVEPPTPRKKRKMNEFVRLVTFVAVIRKRPRIVPPANYQMTVSANYLNSKYHVS